MAKHLSQGNFSVSYTSPCVSLLPPLYRREAGALAGELVSHTQVEAPDSSLDVQGRPKFHGYFILPQQGQNWDGFSDRVEQSWGGVALN